MILTKNGNLMKFASGAAVNAIIPDPYNPLGLPPFTIRCKFMDGFSPYIPNMGDSQTLVDAEEKIWDITKNSTDWNKLFQFNSNLVAVLGANTKNVTNLKSLFSYCSNLSSVSIFDTSLVTNMDSMFAGCGNLLEVPLYDTSVCTIMQTMFNQCRNLIYYPLFDTKSCTDMGSMFNECNSLQNIQLFDFSGNPRVVSMFSNCYKVETNILNMYNLMSSKNLSHNSYTFYNCGRDTVTGAAELAQIPTSWGGTAS